MKRMRRLTLHIEHRQITLAVTPTPRANTRPSAEENNRSHGSSSPVPPGCPMCGGSWDFVIAQPSDQTPASAQALQSMLRNAGIHLHLSEDGELRICGQSFQLFKETIP